MPDQVVVRAAVQVITDALGGCIEFYDDSITKLYHDLYIQLHQFDHHGNDDGCYSALGMITEDHGIWNDEGGRYQKIALSAECLEWPNIIQHEFYHALGFYHEQNRNDQADHIVVHWENIPEIDHRNFKPIGKYWMDIGEQYEIDSIMHYGGIIDHENQIYSMTRVDNGKPVEPLPFRSWEYPGITHPSSIDIIQAHKNVRNFLSSST